MLFDLAGKSVLVTGASSGIGRATAILLSSLGVRVTATGRNEDRLGETLSRLDGEGHSAIAFDMAQGENLLNILTKLAAQRGPFDGVVHAAGKQVTMPARLTTASMADDIIRTNLTSALMLAGAFSRKTFRAPGASLVLISSIMGLNGKAGLSAYSATKAAVAGLVRSLAVELAPEKVRVNCIAPAFVETGMLNAIRESVHADAIATLEQAHPLGFGSPEDVAAAAAFLISPAAKWITGITLLVDGGYSAQ